MSNEPEAASARAVAELRHGRAIGVGAVAVTLAVFLAVGATTGFGRAGAVDLALLGADALALVAILVLALRRN
jgi:hypothetical protein